MSQWWLIWAQRIAVVLAEVWTRSRPTPGGGGAPPPPAAGDRPAERAATSAPPPKEGHSPH